jgi:raffinose/stachyose/melibiose transport system permease protein
MEEYKMKNDSFYDKFKTYLVFAGPTTFIFFSVVIIPFLFGIYLTFTNYDGLSNVYQFIGLSNYIEVFNDGVYWGSFLLTLKYVGFTVIFVNTIAFLLAYFLTSGIKGQNIMRAGFFTPNLIGGVILGLIWRFIFSRVIVDIGQSMDWAIFSSSWLSNPDKAFWTMVIVSTWQYSGYMMLIYIAGFMNVPKSVLEAATIDGANEFQKIKSVIMPLMVPSFVVSIFLTLQRGFLVYDLNISLTEGGPFKSTELISMHIYQKAFMAREYGIGQSQAVFLFLMVATITFTQVYFSKKMEVEQ